MKRWYQSKSIQGAIVAMLAIVLRNTGIGEGDIEPIVAAACDLVSLIAGAYSVYGRAAANERVTL